jgi:uncharacterized flavoprotein (TIGR03862 family)
MNDGPPLQHTEILVIGAGPAGLMAADRLSSRGYGVRVVDAMPSPARKFLMAGRGGLNLTHSEPLFDFIGRYREARSWLAPMIRQFDPHALIDWCHDLGEETFVGSSGRVFPKSFKASPLLRAWLNRLNRQGVTFAFRHRFTDFNHAGHALLLTEKGAVTIKAKAIVLALGGASWPKLGSRGDWVETLQSRGITVHPFVPANMAVLVDWSDHIIPRFGGEPIKRVELHHNQQTVRGETVLTQSGLEGGAIYALSASIRKALQSQPTTRLTLDLRPDMPEKILIERLQQPRGKASQSTFLHRAAGLAPIGIALMREACGGPLPQDASALTRLIKALPLTITGIAGLERAISSAGGIARDMLDDQLMLKALPGVFACGEMLDWEAPTGGYLLQACFAQGHAVAHGIEQWLCNQIET